MSEAMLCPTCKEPAIADQHVKETVLVTAIIIRGYCKTCGEVEETIFVADASKKGKELAELLSQRI
jgi:hypothetical protein